ncbi:uncharacterized protein LOC129770584 [Toxorhynchites rutilus septentrionalis]|uniref:uncharacterized protein LOC129770584 n=1 Tax=Toxorhynchites rutilus septentrionalis TaxID=329112 RepID=UPI00247AE040|nr:uncharacterized protein LOC129770584 [Toxorhynchites rutilus septentrionalis]XP_055629483.1 uncharacterized protein LOC129770584 [Toxorhynchites rutilus septentrionalis]
MNTIVYCILIVELSLAYISPSSANERDQNQKEAKINFFNFDPRTGTYNFGYQTEDNGQFRYETRGLDGVTYGCYGYVGQNGRTRVTHYVSDAHGYRVIQPQFPVQIFFNDPSVNNSEAKDSNDSEKPAIKSELRWTGFFLPRACVGNPTRPPSINPGIQTQSPTKPTSVPRPTIHPITLRPTPATNQNGTMWHPCCHQTNTPSPSVSGPQADVPLLGPVLGLVGGLLGGLLGALSIDLNLDLIPAYYLPYFHDVPSNIRHIPCDDCGDDSSGYLGLTPTVFVPKTLADRIGLSAAFQTGSKNIHNVANMFQLLKDVDGSWRAQMATEGDKGKASL